MHRQLLSYCDGLTAWFMISFRNEDSFNLRSYHFVWIDFVCKKGCSLDCRTTNVGYPLRYKKYFDLKYNKSGVADWWKHCKSYN